MEPVGLGVKLWEPRQPMCGLGLHSHGKPAGLGWDAGAVQC